MWMDRLFDWMPPNWDEIFDGRYSEVGSFAACERKRAESGIELQFCSTEKKIC